MKKVKLIPPDKSRCQTQWLDGSFMTFGPRPMVRCEQKPVWIAVENKKNADGQRGSMSLCGEHRQALVNKFGENYCTFKAIKESK